jgi:hypothetical protein
MMISSQEKQLSEGPTPSHAFLWLAYEPESVTPDTLTLLRSPDTERFRSVVTEWELTIKQQNPCSCKYYRFLPVTFDSLRNCRPFTLTASIACWSRKRWRKTSLSWLLTSASSNIRCVLCAED